MLLPCFSSPTPPNSAGRHHRSLTTEVVPDWKWDAPGRATKSRGGSSMCRCFTHWSKVCTQNAILVNGKHDQIPRSAGGLILTHTHMAPMTRKDSLASFVKSPAFGQQLGGSGLTEQVPTLIDWWMWCLFFGDPQNGGFLKKGLKTRHAP